MFACIGKCIFLFWMHKSIYFLIVLFNWACSDSLDTFYPLNAESIDKLPTSYTVNDTLVYVYSDSLGMDTLSFVVQPYNDYLINHSIPEYDHATYHQIIEQELKALNGSASLMLIFGTGYQYSDFDSEKLYFKYKGKIYCTYLSLIQSKPDPYVYPLRSDYNSWPSIPDSVFLSYSSYTGIQHVQNINEGYQLTRIQ